ncbi:MAG TPA: hypothetical protein VIV06_09815 [Candidatus Limnocylindrales bacterium]
MAVLYLGLLAKRAGILLHATFSGPDGACNESRALTLHLAEQAATRQELIDGVAQIAKREGMVVESSAPEVGKLVFYLWHLENEAAG